ncbi:MAG: translesion DNA synthesis-associated protein ImuA [Luminiphilus sp.]
MADPLEHIINRSDTWRGMDTGNNAFRQHSPANSDWHGVDALPTGFTELDNGIALGGWPLHGGIEVLGDDNNVNSMGLFLPIMATLSAQKRWQAFIAPPHIPYAPMLSTRGVATEQILLVHTKNREEQLWATEQAIRSTTCSVVFSWLGSGEYRYAELRKLQLAATETDTLAILFRSDSAAEQHTPFSLRLASESHRTVRILKQRGGKPSAPILLPPEEDLPTGPQPWEQPSEAVRTRTGQILTPVA